VHLPSPALKSATQIVPVDHVNQIFAEASNPDNSANSNGLPVNLLVERTFKVNATIDPIWF
jgi:hypothetical protein